MNQDHYKKIISGQRSNLEDRLLRCVFAFISIFYFAAVWLRNRAFELKLKKVKRVSKPVICIGNLTTGGTGKTPLVIWLCKHLAEKGFSPAVLTRGYKTGKEKFTDEPALLAKGCDKARIVVNPKRYAGAQKAINEHHCDVLVMDDGFQHRQLARDLDIVTIDATCPFGYGKLLPAGLLREPINGLKRADAAVITRYDQADELTIEHLVRKIRGIKSDIVIAKAVHRPTKAVMMKNVEIDIAHLREKKIFAFCGIGNPKAFLNMLKELGLDIAGSRIYNDHHCYSGDDLNDIYEQARYLDADVIVSTQKDWVKTALLSMENKDIDFAYIAVELEFIEGKQEIIKLISDTLEKKNER